MRAELQAKELTVLTDVSDELRIEIDLAQMRDAMVNILLNAAYFTPERGTLTINLRRNRRYVIFSFCDQGPGFPAKERLFQPFYTTRASGSGLGLAIVRNIVIAHSGRVRAFNRAGGGACFEIYLPAPARDPEHPSAETSGKNKTPAQLTS